LIKPAASSSNSTIAMMISENHLFGGRSERVAVTDRCGAATGTALSRCRQATAAERCKSRARPRRRAEFVALATVSWSSCGGGTIFREALAPAWLPVWGGSATGSRLPQARIHSKAPSAPTAAAPTWDIVTSGTVPATLAALALGLWASSREDSRSQEEPEIQLDPGRSVLNSEWLYGEGSIIKDVPLDASGDLSVTAYAASKSEPLPEGVPRFSRQEWRVLRFCPAVGVTDLVQSVTKVIVPPFLSTDKVRLRPEALPLWYTKTLATVVLSTLAMMRVPILTIDEQQEPPRILCIGLGGGSVPSFLANALPHCQVDVAELEAPVLEAATEMGFHERPNLRVSLADGAAYAAEQLVMNDGGEGVYDAIVVDAYDAAGNVPADLRERGSPLAKALSRGLLRRRGGLVVANILPMVDPVPILAAYRASLADHGVGPGFTVREPGAGNRMIVQVCADPDKAPQDEDLKTALGQAAVSVEQEIKCPFAMKELAVNQLRTWSEWKELSADGWAEGSVEEPDAKDAALRTPEERKSSAGPRSA